MSSCLITKTGKVVECLPGATHERTCVLTFKLSLCEFLNKKAGGVRVKLYQDEAAIEGFDFPTPKQRYKINAILRINDIFKLTTSFRGGYDVKNSFSRPIRSLRI